MARSRALRTLPAPLLLVLASAVAVLSAPGALAHESAEHGTLRILVNQTEEAPGDPPHAACDVWIGGTDVGSTAGFIEWLEAPTDFFPSYWNTTPDFNGSEDGLVVEGTTDSESPVTFAAGPFTYLPPGEFLVRATLGEDWPEAEHATPAVPFAVDGPCGPLAVPCPADFAAALQADGSVLLTWDDDGQSNGTTVLRAVTNANDLRFLADVPAHANRHHDRATYAGTTFHYSLAPYNDPWGRQCPVLEVSVPGERTHFPCPYGIQAWPTAHGYVLVDWGIPEGSNSSVLHRDDGDGVLAPRDTTQWWEGHRDVNVTEGVPYTYMATALYAEGESQDCPTATLQEGWAYPGPGEPWPSPTTTPAPPPPCPTDLALERQDDGTVLVSWTPAPGSNHTQVFRKQAGGEWAFLAAPDASIASFHDRNATAEGAYTYTLRATYPNWDSSGCGEASIAAIPDFPTAAAAFLAVAGAAGTYGWLARRRAP